MVKLGKLPSEVGKEDYRAILEFLWIDALVTEAKNDMQKRSSVLPQKPAGRRGT